MCFFLDILSKTKYDGDHEWCAQEKKSVGKKYLVYCSVIIRNKKSARAWYIMLQWCSCKYLKIQHIFQTFSFSTSLHKFFFYGELKQQEQLNNTHGNMNETYNIISYQLGSNYGQLWHAWIGFGRKELLTIQQRLPWWWWLQWWPIHVFTWILLLLLWRKSFYYPILVRLDCIINLLTNWQVLFIYYSNFT